MRDDRERDTLREIQRQFEAEDPSFVRSFHIMQSRSPSDQSRRVHTPALLVATALIVLMLLGPNVLTKEEIVDRRTPPAPRRSSATQRPLDALTGPIGVPAARTLERLGVPEPDSAVDRGPATPGTTTCINVTASPSPGWRAPSAAA